MIEINYSRAAELDPLEIDADIVELSGYNEKRDIRKITKLAHKAVSHFHGVETTEEAYAVVRDLDFIASSLDRHEINIRDVDSLEKCMVNAAELGETVPRGTITTYAGINPSGDRQRSFTGSHEEDRFIDSLRVSFNDLEPALNGVSGLRINSSVEDYVDALNSGAHAMRTMTDAMVDVRRTISPEFFTSQIRPYFEPLEIDGTRYMAANGSQLQLVGMEKMVYGIGHDGSVEHDFFIENFPYLNGLQRQLVNSFTEANGEHSVLTLLEVQQREGNDIASAVTSLIGMTRMIRKFRYPHRKVAEDNFNLRPDGSVGSGSYTLAVLTDLIESTEARMVNIQEIQNDNK